MFKRHEDQPKEGEYWMLYFKDSLKPYLATRKLEQDMRWMQELFKTEKDSHVSSTTPKYVYLLTGFSLGVALTSFVVAIAVTRRFNRV